MTSLRSHLPLIHTNPTSVHTQNTTSISAIDHSMACFGINITPIPHNVWPSVARSDTSPFVPWSGAYGDISSSQIYHHLRNEEDCRHAVRQTVARRRESASRVWPCHAGNSKGLKKGGQTWGVVSGSPISVISRRWSSSCLQKCTRGHIWTLDSSSSRKRLKWESITTSSTASGRRNMSVKRVRVRRQRKATPPGRISVSDRR